MSKIKDPALKANKKKFPLHPFELVWYILTGLVGAWGLTYIVLGLIAENLPVKATDEGLVKVMDDFTKTFKLDFFGWASAARASQARETAKKMREEADELERRADGKTAEIESLDAYRMELLAKSPLPGLEIREGDIFVDGVPFDRVNSARKMRIAVEVAKLRAGELGLICVDGAEMLDEEAFKALCDGMRDSGLQMICTRVSAGPINVRREA